MKCAPQCSVCFCIDFQSNLKNFVLFVMEPSFESLLSEYLISKHLAWQSYWKSGKIVNSSKSNEPGVKWNNKTPQIISFHSIFLYNTSPLAMRKNETHTTTFLWQGDAAAARTKCQRALRALHLIFSVPAWQNVVLDWFVSDTTPNSCSFVREQRHGHKPTVHFIFDNG